jgi:hypothetical protein
MADRENEIDIDHQYWADASTFIVVNKLNNEIVGDIQFIPKKNNNKIPVEFGSIIPPENISLLNSFKIPGGNFSEIYRCRRSMTLKGIESVIVISMLFKAIWAKVIQTNTAYSYITFDPLLNELRNLYVRRLSFSNPGVFLSFNGSSKKWSLLVKDWIKHETSFATLGKSQFYLLTWVRKNLKKKNLHIRPPLRPVTARLFPENKTALFTRVVKTGKHQSRARRRILNRNRVS